MFILALSSKCSQYEVFFARENDIEECESCLTIHTTNKVLADLIFGVGVFAAVTKVIIGFIMLKEMKTKLHKPYLDVRRNVWITMCVTWLVMGFNAYLNFKEKYSFSIFWILVIIPLKDIQFDYVFLKFSLSFLNVVLEVFLMCFTADYIDYRGYLYALLLKKGKLTYMHKASLFLVIHHPKVRVANFRSNSQMPNDAGRLFYTIWFNLLSIDFTNTLLSTTLDENLGESIANNEYNYLEEDEYDLDLVESDMLSRTYTQVFDQMHGNDTQNITIPKKNRKTLVEYKDKVNASTIRDFTSNDDTS